MFITFEGDDGTGKTTQILRLAESLRSAGYEVVTTQEPGGTAVGKQIRHVLLHSGDVSPKAEALLYAADRAHHVDTVVRPALERGAVVLADRYIDSSIAYQGVARALGTDEIRSLSTWATGGLLPDLTILVDMPTSVSMARLGQNHDRIESTGFAFHAAVRQEFLALAAAEPERWVVIDGSKSVDDVAAAVRRSIAPVLARLEERKTGQ
ncbi:MAG: dTMP kinase [Ancrocorticia sp.]|jgi:dTMP kinase|nr:dTMP kinase [Ancrocorticia sp.]MCI2012831.1 dTMP kinase [Ancrocorticia sp.]